jgi:uncharacterized protein YdhG (YjbR/CyaY superfamily)
VTNKPRTIDEYLATIDNTKRAALQRLREEIHAAAPKAEECISYGVPAFRQGRMVVGFGATSKHCTFYLMSSTILESFGDETRHLDTSKGTIRFQPDHPLPASLVHELVHARLEQNQELDRHPLDARQIKITT